MFTFKDKIAHPYMSNWISSRMGMVIRVGYPQLTIYPRKPKNWISNELEKIKCFKKSVVGFIVSWTPEFDNIPETTEKLGCPTDNIADNRFFKTLDMILFIWNLIFRLSRAYCQLRVSHPYPWKFSCSCMSIPTGFRSLFVFKITCETSKVLL